MVRFSSSGIAFVLVSVGYVLSLYGNLYRLLLIFFAAAILLVALLRGMRTRDVSGIVMSMLMVLPLYLYMAGSAMLTPDPGLGYQYASYAMVSVLPALALGVLLGMSAQPQQFMNGFLILTATFLALTPINYYLTGDPMLYTYGSIRTVFAIILCVSTPFLMGKWLSGNGVGRWLALAVLAASLYSMRESRSVLLLVAPMVLLMVFAYRRRLFITAVIFAVPVFVLAATLPLMIEGSEPPIDLGRLTSETNLDVKSVLDDLALPPEQRIDFERRLTTYTALERFTREPIFAAGYTGVWQENLSKYNMDTSAHGYIGNIGELGLAGVMIFVLIVGFALLNYRRAVIGRFSALLSGRVPIPEACLILSFFELLLVGTFHQVMESVVFGLTLGLVLGVAWERRYVQRAMQAEANAA